MEDGILAARWRWIIGGPWPVHGPGSFLHQSDSYQYYFTNIIHIKGRVQKKFSTKVWSFPWSIPNKTPIFKKNRIILGHPKHVLYLVPSPNVIAKALNVMFKSQCSADIRFWPILG